MKALYHWLIKLRGGEIIVLVKGILGIGQLLK
jgi:hypothetical protein